MKKILFLLFFVTVIVSCNKENVKCWRCQLTGPSGTQTKDTCTNSDPSTFQFVDSQGFNLSHTCTEK